MQALKALVIVMGVLILLGMAVVAVTLYKRATQRMVETRPPAGAEEAVSRAFGTRLVAIPPGATLRRVFAEGDRLLVQLSLADGTPGVLVLDLRDGSVLGQIEFPAAAP
jgi:hypothetical protein